MKKLTKVFSLFGVMILIVAAIGCDNDGGVNDGEVNSNVLTENDFVDDPTLSAYLGEHTVVTFLEPPDSVDAENDIGEAGADVISMTVQEAGEHTFSWGAGDSETGHLIVLEDAKGKVLELKSGDRVTVFLEAGDYDVTFIHDGITEKGDAIFMISNEIQDTPEIESTTRLNIISYLIFFYFHTCVGCDLSGANLGSLDLRNANLERANLSNAFLNGALWCDGECTCGPGSTGICEGCSPQSSCTGP